MWMLITGITAMWLDKALDLVMPSIYGESVIVVLLVHVLVLRSTEYR